MLLLNVDDDREDQLIFCEALGQIDKSIECIGASGPSEAFEILRKVSPLPSYIFTDVNMPRMDGMEFLRYLKTHSRFKDIPVIILSTSIHKDDEAAFIKLGAKKVFQKPPSFNELITLIKSVLETPFR